MMAKQRKPVTEQCDPQLLKQFDDLIKAYPRKKKEAIFELLLDAWAADERRRIRKLILMGADIDVIRRSLKALENELL
jgi:hypothetical protein